MTKRLLLVTAVALTSCAIDENESQSPSEVVFSEDLGSMGFGFDAPSNNFTIWTAWWATDREATQTTYFNLFNEWGSISGALAISGKPEAILLVGSQEIAVTPAFPVELGGLYRLDFALQPWGYEATVSDVKRGVTTAIGLIPADTFQLQVGSVMRSVLWGPCGGNVVEVVPTLNQQYASSRGQISLTRCGGAQYSGDSGVRLGPYPH